MSELLDRAQKVIEHIPLNKADFLEVRFFKGESTAVAMRNGAADQISTELKTGAGLRALIDGAWGFSTSTSFKLEALRGAMKTAVSAARGMATHIGERGMVPQDYVYQAHSPLDVKTDPRTVPLEEKVKVAIELEKHIRSQGERIKVSTSNLSDVVQTEAIANSLGTRVEVSSCYSRLAGSCAAREGVLIQNASESLGTSKGWETMEEANPTEMGERVGKRGLDLLAAEPAPKGRMSIVMDPTLVGVFIHEAFGHAAEADGVLRRMSVLEGKIGKQVGVPGITVIDDPTIKGLRGSFAYDSEGTKTCRRTIVENGLQKEYYQSLETAAKMGVKPNGSARAMDFTWKPIPRMGNTYVESGEMSLEELCEQVGEGAILQRSYGGYVNPSIGQFYFTTQQGHIIKKGEIGPLFQNVSMSGMTLEVLMNVLGIGKGVEMAFPGTCGKAGQSAPVSGGGPHLAVANVVLGGR